MSNSVVVHPKFGAVVLRGDGSWESAAVLSTGSSSSADDVTGFRGVPWGSPKSVVAQREQTGATVESDTILVYTAVLNGLDVDVIYIFVGDELARAKYVVTEKFVNDNNYIAAFDRLKETLAQKYGPASGDNEYWSNDLYKDEYAEWGMAVSCGHYSRYVNWAKDTGDAWLALSGENYKVDVVVEYNSARHAEAVESQKSSQLLADP